jgi:ATP-binding cassette subfamily B protein
LSEKKKGPKTGFARLMELAMTKKPLILSAMVLSVLASIASFVPYMSIYFIIRQVIGAVAGTPFDRDAAISYGVMAILGTLGQIVLYFAALMCSHLAAVGTLYQLKVEFATHLAKVPLGFHVLAGSGKLRKVMDENIEKIEGFIAHQLPDMTAAMVSPVVALILLFVFDWRFGLAVTFGLAIAVYMYIGVYGNESAREKMNQYQNALEEMNNASVEYIRGISVVKAFKQTVFSFRRLYATIKSYTEVIIPYTLGWEKSYSAAMAIVNNLYIFVLPVAALVTMLNPSAENASNALFYIIFAQAVGGVLVKAIYANGAMMQVDSHVAGMDAILAEKRIPVTSSPKSSNDCDIELSEVSFSYGKGVEALSGISFVAPQGKVTALVGPSGGGKSTIAHLIPRFFDVTKGAVAIGGVDIREMDPHKLMDMVSFVFQDVFLFKQSVMENIRMGNPSASDEDVIKAAKDAQCHEFIEKLPEGYKTVIGTKGAHLSGGERQRVAIARAIVKNCPIVVLDEATAFSDPENEHLIQKAFERLMQGKTVVMIAHRLSTVVGADKIIVVDSGTIVEQGTHEELLKKRGKYAQMWEAYTKTASWRMGVKGATA